MLCLSFLVSQEVFTRVTLRESFPLIIFQDKRQVLYVIVLPYVVECMHRGINLVLLVIPHLSKYTVCFRL